MIIDILLIVAISAFIVTFVISVIKSYRDKKRNNKDDAEK